MHVPEAFHFDTVFGHNLVEKAIPETERENLKNTSYFILDALSRHKYDALALKKFDATGYLPLSAETMKETCGDRYRLTLDIMLKEGVVEQSGTPFDKGRSRQYRLSNVMEQSPQVFKELGGTVRSRYLARRARKQAENQQKTRSLKHLTQWLDESRLTVRETELHNFLELAFARVKRLIASSHHAPEVKAELLGRAALRMNHQLASVRRVLQGDFNASNSGRDERLHTTITGMKRELRSFLLYDGQPLVSLDIRSSQPYFFQKLLSKKLLQGEESEALSMRSLVSGQGFSERPLLSLLTSTTFHSDFYSIILPDHSQLTDKQLIAKSGFREVEWNEGFYWYFARKSTVSEPSAVEVERMKQSIMWVFFEPRSTKLNSNAFKSLEEALPLVASVIRNIHGIGPKLLPLLLQRLEARILLYRVAKKISKQLPLAPLLTIHDCVLTTPEYAERVKALMSTETAAIVGVAPGIKEELKTADHEFADVGVSGRLKNGIDSFAEGTFKRVEKSYQKSQKIAKKKDVIPPSLAHITLDSPLRMELPHYENQWLFSGRFYDPNAEALPENPAHKA